MRPTTSRVTGGSGPGELSVRPPLLEKRGYEEVTAARSAACPSRNDPRSARTSTTRNPRSFEESRQLVASGHGEG